MSVQDNVTVSLQIQRCFYKFWAVDRSVSDLHSKIDGDQLEITCKTESWKTSSWFGGAIIGQKRMMKALS